MKLFFVDDLPENHAFLNPLINLLVELDPESDWVDGYSGTSARDCLTKPGLLSALSEPEGVILLDVELGDRESLIRDLKSNFAPDLNRADEIVNHPAIADLVLDSVHHLAVWIMAIALVRGCKVVVSSKVGAGRDAAEALGVPAGKFPHPRSRDPMPLLTDLARIIIGGVTGYHSDKWVNSFIRAWIKEYRVLKKAGMEGSFCHHESLKDDESNYPGLIGAMCGLETPLMSRDSNGRKAFLELETEPSAAVQAEGWFETWDDLALPDNYRKPIAIDDLRTVLENASDCTLHIDVTKNGDPATQAHLPVSPGLSFVASLRRFIQSLCEQDNSILGNSPLYLFGRDGRYRLSVPLKPHPERIFSMPATWVRKCQTGGPPITTNGVSAALWNLSLAKVAGVKETVARNDVERALLRVFQGPGRPVASVGFAPQFVHLYWWVAS